MKKAKDYVNQYLANPCEDELRKILVAVIMESQELEQQRGKPGSNSNDVSIAILDELHQKWIAICNRLDNVVEIDKNALPKLLFTSHPELKRLWNPRHLVKESEAQNV